MSDENDFAKAYEEFNKPAPGFRGFGPGATLQRMGRNAAVAALSRVPGGRHYAVDNDDSNLDLAALCTACARLGRPIGETVAALAKVLPGWVRRLRPVPELVELLVDKCTKQQVANPFCDPKDYKSIEFIRATSPDTAAWLEQMAKNGNKPTFAMIHDHESRVRDAEEFNSIRYGPDLWRANLLRPGSGATLTAKNLFVRSIADPHLVQAHREEAEAGSPRLQADNLTICMAVEKQAGADARAAHKLAGEIAQQWRQEQKRQAA